MFLLGKSLEVKLLIGVYLTLKQSAKQASKVMASLYFAGNKVGGLPALHIWASVGRCHPF